MTEELAHFVEITDKWSKRRFALKLDSSTQFATHSDFINYLNSLQQSDINELIENGKLGKVGEKGLEDIRTALFEIKDDGNLGNMFNEIKIKQKGRTLEMNSAIKFEHITTGKEGYSDIFISSLILDRDNLPFTRNWDGFYKRRWELNPQFKEYVESIVSSKYGEKAEQVLSLETFDDKIDFLKAISEVIYNTPYEIYSRFIGRNLRFKNGPDTLESIMENRGGNCSEKASALDFIAYNYGIAGQIISAGDNATGSFPNKTLRRALDDFEFSFKDNAQRYWSHYANYFEIDEVPILIDATGGPIPFLFCVGDEVEEYLSQKKALPVLFVSREENYYYHRSPSDIIYDLLFTMEAFLPDMDIYHVFGPEEENDPFGFIITNNLWICPTAYKTTEEYSTNKKLWLEWAQESVHVTNIEIYPNMNSSSEKKILQRIEEENPILVADLRAAEDGFVERCRSEWKDKNWYIGYVFAEFL